MTEQTKRKKRTGAVKKAQSDKESSQPNAVSRYIRETRGEMRKVTWPTREEAQRLTAIVLAFTAAFALFLGLLDFLWSNTLEATIRFLVGA